MNLLFIVSIIYVVYQLLKEAFTKPIPEENWANRKQFYQDLENGIPIKECIKNLENGKYKLPKSDKDSNDIK